MKKILWRTVLIGLGCASAMNVLALTPPAQILPTFGNLPLYFEAASSGQVDRPARFMAPGGECQFLISPGEVCLELQNADAATKPTNVRTVRMQFVGVASQAQIRGVGELPGKVNYLIGNNPAQWRTDVATYARVQVEQLYPGINLVYYGNQRQLEYDFTIAPGANPDLIKIHFAGVDKISIGTQGELTLALGGGEICQPAPVIYQMVHGRRQAVSGGYRLVDARTVEFAIGKYDHQLPLVIDPILSYATYFGGSGNETAFKVAVDTNGFVYVVGETTSSHLATPGAFQTNFAGGSLTGDAFVAKFGPTGTNLVYCTYLGGSQDDFAYGLAVDDLGDVFLTGATDSPNFPTTNALYPRILGHQYVNPRNGAAYYNGNAFVAELGPSGSNLIYSTYLGGSGFVGNANQPGTGDEGLGVAVDTNGNAYVTGYTTSTNFPCRNPLVWQLNGTNNTFNHLTGIYNAFLTKIGPGGSNLVYSTYFGGTNVDVALGVAVDAVGTVYLTGYTDSPNFPTDNPVQPYFGGATNPVTSYDAFVAKFAPSTANPSLIYSTFLGGTNSDLGYGIVADTNGNAYVVGGTASPDFPDTATNVPGLYNGLTNNLTAGYPYITNAFLTEITTNDTIGYSAVFGGTNTGVDIGYGLALDAAGDAFVVGASSTSSFPTTNTPGFLGAGSAGGSDAFVIGFNNNASAILYSGYLGGSGNDYGYGIAVDSLTNVFIVGQTASANFPTLNAYQPSLEGSSDAFLAKIGWSNAPPMITDQSSLTNRLVGTGAFVSFSVTATGTPPLFYHWQLNGTNLVNGAHISGATNATLTIYPVQTNDSGSYQVVVTNFAGSVTSTSAVLTVTSVPFFTLQPTNQTVGVGSTAQFNFNATFQAPAYGQWLKDGIDLMDGTNASGSVISGATNNFILTIKNVQTNDAGHYWVIVTNNYGSITSDVATLTVDTLPVILVAPTNQTVGEGAAVTFVVHAVGTLPLSYQWLKNGNYLFNSGHISGATNSALTINNAQPPDAASYSVIITNSVGSVTSSPPAVLTVLTAPLFGSIIPGGTNGGFILSGEGGLSSDTYFVLTSTNLTTPLAEWTPIETNQFDSQGGFVFTNLPPANAPQQFYLLQMQ